MPPSGSVRRTRLVSQPRRALCWPPPPWDNEGAHDNGVGVTEPGPLLNQFAHDGSHLHNLPGHEGAVLIPLDLLVHDGFGLAHADTQRPDYFADFADTVVHVRAPCSKCRQEQRVKTGDE